MFQRKKPQYKFKTYASDAAPFFFFIDVFPLNPDHFKNPRSSFLVNQIRDNPIMPLPMRIDRVFNGVSSIIVRPNDPISFPINESVLAIVNPIPFLQLGLEKLLFFTEIRSNENFSLSLKQKAIKQWWEATKDLYGNLPQIEEDFSAFLRAYLYTIIKAKINGEDIIGAAIEYCEIVNNICKERMMRNNIIVEINKNQENVKLFKEKIRKYREKLKIDKKTEYHPELIDIEVINLSGKDFSNQGNIKDTNEEDFDLHILKYIPLLFYDDLQECMLQNLRLLEMNEFETLDPTNLLNKNVILLQKSEDLHENVISQYGWLSNLSEVNIGKIYNSITELLNQFYENI